MERVHSMRGAECTRQRLIRGVARACDVRGALVPFRGPGDSLAELRSWQTLHDGSGRAVIAPLQ